MGAEGAGELERERLVGAGERGNVGEVPVDVGPIEHGHAAPLAQQPVDRIGEDGEGTAEAVGVLQARMPEQQAEPSAAADRPRLQRDGAEVDHLALLVDREDRRHPATLGGRPVQRALRLDPVDAPVAEPRLRQADPVEDRPHHRALGQPAGTQQFAEQGLHGVYPIAVNVLINIK